MNHLKYILPVLLLIASCSREEKDNRNHQEIKDCSSVIEENFNLKKENDSLKSLLISEEVNTNYWYSNTKESEANLGSYVDSVLRSKHELIPLKPVLGGTMSFGIIQLLGSEWVIAEYDDGHVMGRAIYEYKIDDKGDVSFKLLKNLKEE